MVRIKFSLTTLFQDVAEFGGEKHITVGVATLVPLPSADNNSKTSSSPYLEIKAASNIIELAIVGKKLQRHFQQGVSHQAVAANRPVHVANIHKHGGVHFFIPEHRKEEVCWYTMYRENFLNLIRPLSVKLMNSLLFVAPVVAKLFL